MENTDVFEPAINAIKSRSTAIASQCEEKAKHIISVAESKRTGWVGELSKSVNQLHTLEEERDSLIKAVLTLQKQQKPKSAAPPTDHFQVSSMFLRESWIYLTSDQQQRERMHLITGPIAPDGTRILSKMEKLKFEKQSATYVSGNLANTMHRMTILDEKYGHLMLGMFHNHLGNGQDSTMPSGIDMNFMFRYAKLGIHCLGGIFSLDGYVRFFNAGNRPFSVEVYGKGWNLIQETKSFRVFRIKEGY